MQNKDQTIDKNFEIEPDFRFCWTLAWRLIFLSLTIGLIPLLAVNLCLGIVGAALPGVLAVGALVVGNILVLVLAFTISLKILLSKSYKNSFIRFYSVDV